MPRFLSLDDFAGQKTSEARISLSELEANIVEVKQVFRDFNITTSFIPSGCTGYVQVLDVAINKPLMNRIGELTDIHYEEHFVKWLKGTYTVGDRRIMLKKWVGQARGELHSQQASVIHRTFRRLFVGIC